MPVSQRAPPAVFTRRRRNSPAGSRRPTAAPAVGERLTKREPAVLRLLPSRMTQREIGATSSRDDAVARARAAGLL
jgi:hypothetical protein